MYDIDCSEEDIVFTCGDILRVVNNIDIYKSSGIDFLPTFILKDCFMVILDQLVYLFNQSITLGTFSESWKIATITPIPKTGDLSQVTNWSPISIIPLIGKMMESLCNSFLNNYLDVNNLLCDEQHGFRKNRSTSMAIFNYIKFLCDEMNKHRLVGCIYVDFTGAFDSINHERLIEKLKDIAYLGSYYIGLKTI